jgi:tRNA threonylcarbamoyladenosine biosynthesis protein TsaB
MLVLGLETSTARSSIALVDRDGVVASASLGVPRRHGEFLAPAIAFCCEQAGVRPDQVTGVAVGLGPGLYTGLRVGIATAQTFAAARRLPVVGLSGLDVVAFGARYVRRLLCVALDARRGEVFHAFYRAAPGGVQRQSELRVGRPETLVAEIEAAGEDVLVLGDAAVTYRELLEGPGIELAGPEVAAPDAAVLAELAVPRFEREETQRPEELRPIYLRQADARIGWEQRGRLRGGQAPDAPEPLA